MRDHRSGGTLLATGSRDIGSPGEIKARIGAFVDFYKTERHHESLNNLPPEDGYTASGQTVLNCRQRIKLKTRSERSRLYYQCKVA
jgi:hypothetical protein